MGSTLCPKHGCHQIQLANHDLQHIEEPLRLLSWNAFFSTLGFLVFNRVGQNQQGCQLTTYVGLSILDPRLGIFSTVYISGANSG
jgi:hypothetical protein